MSGGMVPTLEFGMVPTNFADYEEQNASQDPSLMHYLKFLHNSIQIIFKPYVPLRFSDFNAWVKMVRINTYNQF